MKEKITNEQWDSLTPAQKKKIGDLTKKKFGISIVAGEVFALPGLTDLMDVLLQDRVEIKTMLLRAMQSLFAPQVQVHRITNQPVGVTCNAEIIEPIDLIFKIIKEKV